MVKANRAIQIPINPTNNQEQRFYHTLQDYQYCRKRTVEYCWDNPKEPSDLVTSKRQAEDALYHELRDETDKQLHANLVQKAIQDVTSVIDSLKKKWKKASELADQSGMWKSDGL